MKQNCTSESDFSDIEVFFHIGVERTGTKFLQKTIFPTYTSVFFINKNKYKKAKKIIARKKYKRYLVSMELNLDNHFEDEIKDFSATFPNAKIIMVLRQQHSWLASHYKRIVKNGNNIAFRNMLDLKTGNSIYQITDLYYMNKFKIVEKYFTIAPLYLLYTDLKDNPVEFLKKIANYVGEPFNEKILNLNKRHASYSENQLKALQKVMKYVNISRNKPTKYKIINFLHRLYVDSIRYTVFFIAKNLPNSKFRKSPLINPEELQQVEDYYKKDWEETVTYVKSHQF